MYKRGRGWEGEEGEVMCIRRGRGWEGEEGEVMCIRVVEDGRVRKVRSCG